MPLTLKSNNNISNMLSQNTGTKNNIAYFNNPNDLDNKLSNDIKDSKNSQTIENLNNDQFNSNSNLPSNKTLDKAFDSIKISSDLNYDKNSIEINKNLNTCKNESQEKEKFFEDNNNAINKTNPFDDYIPLCKQESSINNKTLNNANIQLKLKELNYGYENKNKAENEEEILFNNPNYEAHSKNIPSNNQKIETKEAKIKNPFNDSDLYDSTRGNNLNHEIKFDYDIKKER